VLLVGDIRLIEAESPFEQIQQHGMTTAALTEIVRQPEKTKQIVGDLAVRNTKEAVAQLDQSRQRDRDCNNSYIPY
jgi:hypothetical protein